MELVYSKAVAQQHCIHVRQTNMYHHFCVEHFATPKYFTNSNAAYCVAADTRIKFYFGTFHIVRW